MTRPDVSALYDPVVSPTADAVVSLRPLPAGASRITGGFWGQRLDTNRRLTILHGFEQLKRAGNLHNFRLAAGRTEGSYESLGLMFDQPFPFLDSDAYKWLEAVGWELGRGPDDDLLAAADEVIGAVEAAQRPDGYLNTFVQVLGGGRPYTDLAWGHEMYTLGHLVQAAVAWHRAVHDDRLLAVAERAVAHLHDVFGPGRRDAIDGHPEIEMALVELYRVTGERRHLDFAAALLDRRGRGLLPPGRFGSAYWQDHATVREAPAVAGHAVRQLYLDAGAVDVAVELGDEELLAAVRRRWDDMLATRRYLTGGLGSRHRDEAFGDPYELPPDRAYAETCAAIASVMLGWRLLLATGEPAYADAVERAMYNAVLPGVALSGDAYFYVNPLQRRTRRVAAEPGDGRRAAWYACACCPPNLMRTFSTWEHLVAAADADGIAVHQYATGEIAADTPAGPVRLSVETRYPWDGRVEVTVREAAGGAWSLGLRVPAWATGTTLDVGAGARPVVAGVARESREWRAGDRVTLTIPMPVRVTEPHPRVDAVRGCVALERGPLVYCIETADLPAATELEQVSLPPRVEPREQPRPDLAADLIGLTVPALREEPSTSREGQGETRPVEVGAIPYFAWANREEGAVRVWIPLHDPPRPDRADAR